MSPYENNRKVYQGGKKIPVILSTPSNQLFSFWGASFHPNLHSLIINLLHFFLSFLTCVSLSKFQYLCWQSAMFSYLTSHE